MVFSAGSAEFRASSYRTLKAPCTFIARYGVKSR
jgi:hypothetical protein